MNTQVLKREAEFVVEYFFGKCVDSTTIDRYIDANKLVFEKQNDLEISQEVINRLISSSVDIEALEFAWRKENPENMLSKKIQILFYLLEARSEFYPFFCTDRSSFSAGFAQLLGAVLADCLKLVKGKILLRYHGII
jgi:hypothetical protein